MRALSPPSVQQPFCYISQHDTALDRDHESFNWERYVESGEFDFLPLKPGEEPLTFKVRPLTKVEREDVLDIADRFGSRKAARLAVRLALKPTRQVEFEPEQGMAPNWVVDACYDVHDAVVDELAGVALSPPEFVKKS